MKLRSIPLALVLLLAGVSASSAQSRTAQPTTAGGTQSGTRSQSGAQTGDEQQAPERNVAVDPTDLLADQNGWYLLLSGFGGHDTTNWGNSGTANGSTDQFVLSGGNGGGSVRVAGANGGPKGRYAVDGTTSSVYYPSSDELLTDTNLILSGTRRIAQHTEISAAQTMLYAPYYGIGLFPSIGSYGGTDVSSAYVPTTDASTQTAEIFRYFVTTQLLHTISNKSDVSAHYSLSRNDVLQATDSNYQQEVGGRFQRRLNRSLGYHLGYDYGTMRYGGPFGAALNTFDIGLDFDRALSFSRRTTVRFTTGTALITAKGLDATQTDQSRTEFRLLGSANLKHYIGRSWVVDANYARDVQILDGLRTPYFTDGFTAGISGRLGARSTTGVSFGYVTGVPLSIQERQRDHALVLSSWLQQRFSAKTAGYVRLGYYSQRFNYDQLEAIGLADRLSKVSVRVGLNVVFHRNRATR